MKIIDAHIHTSFSEKETKDFAKKNGIDFSWNGLQKSMKDNSILNVIAITTDISDPTPGESNLLLAQAKKDSRLRSVCSINPNYTNQNHVKTVEKLMKNKNIVGIKIFPGYHPVYPNDKKYFPFYKLAGKYGLPVIIHTGDTFGSKYLVKYSHPLSVDEIAVKFPETTFILAHLGFPWVREAAELVYKNENVYADLSAFCIGCAPKTPAYVISDICYALEASERPDKFLYGSDWPLVDMKEYIKIIKKAVPRKHHSKVFYENAKKVFKL